MTCAALAADRDRWKARAQCEAIEVAKNYHQELLAAQSSLLGSEQEAGEARRVLEEQLAQAETQVVPLKTSLQEASVENSRLMREGASLQEQLVEALREASRSGDRLLESWERRSAAHREAACLGQELQQSREESWQKSPGPWPWSRRRPPSCAAACESRG
ncbi:unnamed protein product [Effrenium voratum]|uniref:Uncharacterized protein n=1 Tax=Effrenium voratum TaxID=2562239 RepID=A0AA36MTP1_9DINO|nr:unnamed protein product [Effrenium voratum]CAJ1385515.1 unnamed protein product [Effrenium voratum]CAJ1436513.1 unnamed protein product [Effrenium voratum]